MHCGHLQMEDKYIRASMSALSDEAMTTIMTLHSLNHSPSAIAATVTKLYGNDSYIFTSKQIAHIITKRRTELACVGFDSMSSAEQLLHKFDLLAKEDNDLQYVALIHSSEDGYKIKLPHGRPTVSIENIQHDFSIEQIRQGMRVNDNQDVLLAIAWTTNYERKMISKFPELLTFDVTEKTNNQKRGLFMGTGLDGNGQLFPCIHVFMPNSQKSSYGWIYNHAIPALWDTNTIQNIQAIGTDGEFALYSPLQNLSNIEGPWKGTYIYRYVNISHCISL